MLGRVLASRYRIVTALAQGGFGKTFLAEDTLLPGVPHCVVKQLTVGQDNAAALRIARRLFNQEAITLQKLGKHPQIPQLFAYFEEDNEFFLVQELIEGTLLKDEFQQKGRFSEALSVEFLQDCLNTLAFVHELGVIHRDIKPANLMRRHSDQKIVFLDFGAVKEIEIDQSQLAETTVSIGTRGYMPDEQLRGKPQFASDVYALGMTCLQGLTRTHPQDFERDDYDEICWVDLVPVQPSFAQVLSKMVRRDPRHRYSQVADILTDLNHLFNSGIVTASTIQVIPSTSPLPKANTGTNPSRSEVTSAGMESSGAHGFEQTNRQRGDDYPSQPQPGLSPSSLEAADASTVVSAQAQHLVSPNAPTDVSSHNSSGTQETLAGRNTNNGQLVDLPVIDTNQDSLESTVCQPHSNRAQTDSQDPISKSTDEALPSSSPQALVPPDVLDQRDTKQPKSLKWVVPSSLLLVAGLGAGGYFLLRPSTADQVLQQMQAFYTQDKFTDCINKGESADVDLEVEVSIRDTLAKCYLGAAQFQANQGNFAEALKIVAKVPSKSAQYNQAQQKLQAWSNQLLSQAKVLYEEQGKVKDALAKLAAIPKISPVYDKSTSLTKEWQTTAKENDKFLKDAQAALDDQRPREAIEKAEQVKQPKFWAAKADKIITAANKQIASIPKPAPVPVTVNPAPKPAPVWTPAPAPTPAWTPAPAPAPAWRPAPAPAPAPRAWPSPSPAPRAW
ncbi:protein kinase [Acaryochloris sp. IP29b_bin.148]|uniref:protein kinase domain-containing protein n=1 Tax=Acaryochloris sp. IP29b_bin.148 TaxID=2969218 RepID=UPI002612E65D|nr:protein kinase [Acaryochloris sp. IP29b_bin.148]